MTGIEFVCQRKSSCAKVPIFEKMHLHPPKMWPNVSVLRDCLAVIVIALCFQSAVGYRQVQELDDRWLDRGTEGKPWLIEFYAPWCGHCKRLEPVFHQVNIALENSPVQVAKVDATRYTGFASKYEVRGYPSIIFTQGEEVLHHRGDRTKQGLLDFVRRAEGPTVKPIRNVGKFNDMQGEHYGEVFFFFVGKADPDDVFYDRYASAAKKLQLQSWFYYGEKIVLPQEVAKSLSGDTTILVFKDGAHIELAGAEEKSQEELLQWMRGEQYAAFPKLTGFDLNGMVELDKKVVIVVTNEKDDKNNPKSERLKDIGEALAKHYRDTYHPYFQFIWMGDPESVMSLTMSHVKVPGVIAINASTQQYYLPEIDAENLTFETFQQFLDMVNSGDSPSYGGTGIFIRLYRIFYDIWSSVRSVYDESPWLALVVFGVPSLVISIVCYALCCMEPVDEEELFEELDAIRREQEDAEDQLDREALEGREEEEETIDEKAPLIVEGHIKSE